MNWKKYALLIAVTKVIKYAVIIAFFMAPSAQAQQNPDVQAVQKYLNSLNTMWAKFIQTSPDGDSVSGTFYLNRPGRLRFEYDAPVDDFVVADGNFIYFYDAAVKEQPESYLWMHKRFKTRPADNPESLYKSL